MPFLIVVTRLYNRGFMREKEANCRKCSESLL